MRSISVTLCETGKNRRMWHILNEHDETISLCGNPIHGYISASLNIPDEPSMTRWRGRWVCARCVKAVLREGAWS
jgi:hypothetical protein